MDNIKIYCIYYDQKQLDDYNIKETNILKLFNTNDDLSLDNINHLSRYFCELCCYYYIWKNQIKSDYIGFCHYRRFYHKIYLDYIDDYHTQAFQYPGHQEIYNKKYILEYVKEKYNITDNIYNISFKHSYIFTWKTFNKICEFIFGFYDWISEKLGYDWKDINNIHNIMHNICEYNDFDWPTYLACYNEFAISFYLSHISKIHSFDEDINNIIIYHTNDKEKLFNIYKKNLKTGCKRIFNISDINITENEEFTYRIYDENSYDTKKMKDYLYGDAILFNIHTDLNTFINDLKQLGKNPIVLNNNEYVEAELFSNLNNYKIKSI